MGVGVGAGVGLGVDVVADAVPPEGVLEPGADDVTGAPEDLTGADPPDGVTLEGVVVPADWVCVVATRDSALTPLLGLAL